MSSLDLPLSPVTDAAAAGAQASWSPPDRGEERDLRGVLQGVLAADPSDELKLNEDSLRLSLTEKEPEGALEP